MLAVGAAALSATRDRSALGHPQGRPALLYPVGSARYSVPTRLIGASVNVVIDHGALVVVEPATGAIVAEHELIAPGETSILDEHTTVPGVHPTVGRARKPQWSTSSAL